MFQLFDRIARSLRFRCGLRVAAAALETGDEDAFAAFYRSRVTDCSFLADPQHYEHPRAQWILKRADGGHLLEIGCGNGGMTSLLADVVDQIVALDVSKPSLDELAKKGLGNVETVNLMFEQFQPSRRFDWIVMTEIVEHLRQPSVLVTKCIRWLKPGGSLLITTPNGHWETDEHLHEFNLHTFMELFAGSEAETIQVGYLRDGDERRRWLVGQITAPARPPRPDDFHGRWSVARSRRQRVATQR